MKSRKILILLIILVFLGFFIETQSKKSKLRDKIFEYLLQLSYYNTYLTTNSRFIANILVFYENSLSKIDSSDYLNAQKSSSEEEKVKFCIVIPSYNNLSYASQNLNSLFRQSYHNWRMIYIDDSSSDGMSELVAKIKQNSNLPDDKFTLLRNKERKRTASYSFYYAAHNFCKDEEVMIYLDGDDMLATSNVLNILASAYNDDRIWLTYGSFIEITSGNWGFDYAKDLPIDSWSKIRSLPWTFSHLRSSYTWLFKKIKKEDLEYRGKFISSSWDMAIMYPMLEMAGKQRVKYIDDVTYLYRIHQKNDSAIFTKEQKEMELYIRAKPTYKLLD